MKLLSTNACMWNARRAGTVIPAFNIPFLPMMQAVVEALHDTECFGLIAVARPEWMKFKARSVRAIYEEYQRVKDERFTRLHLDHVPVIDEDNLSVDYEAVIQEAIQLGYQSVMLDGSRLSLPENIQATKKIVRLAHDAGIALEGELGAVFGHEAGPLPLMRNSSPAGKASRPQRTRGDSCRKQESTGCRWRWGMCTGPFRRSRGTTKRSRQDWTLSTWSAFTKRFKFLWFCTGGVGSRKSTFRKPSIGESPRSTSAQPSASLMR